MDTTRAEGAVREAVGNAQDTIGEVIGDASMQLSGKAKELRGKAQQLCVDSAAITRDSIVEKPLTALAVTAAVSFALGALWSWNRGDTLDNGHARRR
jgi:uncharacterized protein YjbJ (UPF0337 family)